MQALWGFQSGLSWGLLSLELSSLQKSLNQLSSFFWNAEQGLFSYNCYTSSMLLAVCWGMFAVWFLWLFLLLVGECSLFLFSTNPPPPTHTFSRILSVLVRSSGVSTCDRVVGASLNWIIPLRNLQISPFLRLPVLLSAVCVNTATETFDLSLKEGSSIGCFWPLS